MRCATPGYAIKRFQRLLFGHQARTHRNEGDFDAFLAKYDSSGRLLWSQQIGTPDGDFSRSVAVDGSGNVFITGSTEGSLEGINAGELDASGNAYITGSTGGSLEGAHVGSSDAFLAKFSPVPEPSTLALAAFGLLGLATFSRRRR